MIGIVQNWVVSLSRVNNVPQSHMISKGACKRDQEVEIALSWSAPPPFVIHWHTHVHNHTVWQQTGRTAHYLQLEHLVKTMWCFKKPAMRIQASEHTHTFLKRPNEREFHLGIAINFTYSCASRFRSIVPSDLLRMQSISSSFTDAVAWLLNAAAATAGAPLAVAEAVAW